MRRSGRILKRNGKEIDFDKDKDRELETARQTETELGRRRKSDGM